jgi:hypothetical protein
MTNSRMTNDEVRTFLSFVLRYFRALLALFVSLWQIAWTVSSWPMSVFSSSRS